MPTQSRKRPSFFLIPLVTASCVAGGWFTPSLHAKDIPIQVGIVQRFGEQTPDQLTITSLPGDSLTLKFPGQAEPLKTTQINLQIRREPLKSPLLQERIVLSDHATFETAEYSAKQWQAKGIAVEVTQPDRWQVWAKREVYHTPLLRRWLLQSLKSQGYTQAYLETALLSQKKQIQITVNGKTQLTPPFKITAGQNRVQVRRGKGKLRRYGGTLNIQPNAYGTFTLVNHVPIETYLRGVVPYEIGPKAPQNAVKAQAILARTYALRNLRRFKADNYQLCANQHCQVYYGLSGASQRVDKAIAATKGLVLTYNNELVDALYSSTSGGVTASFSDVWDGQKRPYLRPLIDSPSQIWDLARQSLADEATFRRFIALQKGFNETGRSVFRWSYQRSLQDLNKDLQKYLERRKHPLAKFTTIKQMAVTKRAPSGRILTLEVETDQGTVNLYKTEARSAFKPPRSTLFYIEPIYGANQQLQGYQFIGGGFGHGVGLSQYGSYNLARLGWSAERILSFYYPGTVLQPLNDSISFWKD